ncbi:MAG: tRNA dihydrouridine synthase [Phycisphaerales bacterium]
MLGVPLQIGPVRLESNLLLAPIAGYCDLAFRLVARSWGGVGLACTDLLSPQGLLRGTATSLDLARTTDEDKPVGMQLYGGDGDILAEGARWAVQHGATVVDINMGCPVDKVTKKDGGSKLLCDPCGTLRMVEKIARAVEEESGGSVPLTAKLRLGWTMDVDVAPFLAPRLIDEGCVAITVHGRYTEQKFRDSCRLDGIKRVVDAVHGRAPVIGNGDVKTPDDCLRMLRETGCAGVMIGRGALSAPWLFRDCWHAQRAAAGLADGPALGEPTEIEKIETVRRYFERMRAFRDDRYAMMQIRRRITWFGKRLGPCKPMKERVRTAKDPAEVHGALDEFLAGGLRWFDHEDRTIALEDERDEVAA